MERGAASTKIQSVVTRSPSPRDTCVDDGAAPRGDAGGVRERVGFLEVDGVAVSWYYDFCRERSPRVAEHYLLRVPLFARTAAAAVLMMLGLALLLARAVMHRRCRAGSSDFAGYLKCSWQGGDCAGAPV